MHVQLIDFKPYESGALKGFCTVQVDGKFSILGCKIFVKDGKRWVGWPQEKRIGADGAVSYLDIILWSDSYHRALQAELRPRIDAILGGGHSYAPGAEVQLQAPQRSPGKAPGHSPGPSGDRDYQNSRKAAEDPAGKDVPW
jgi:hypothetical protein